MKRILLASILLVAIPVFSGLAQDRTITGKVTSEEDGSTLPGVNVIIKGTTTGTVTDIDGNYRLTVPTDAEVLVFSFIGLASQEIVIGNQSIVDLAMAPDYTELSEVIVTAVGIEREKKALGYSVENVSGDKVSGVVEPDPLRALQGKVAGVRINSSSGAPGSSTRITIRGNSSFLNDNQPLFVVDGVPYNNDFNTTEGTNTNTGGLAQGGAFSSRISDLDPNDIQSMTVLKGAAAAALYGSRAANGVILITTKTGSGKPSNKGLEITFNSTFAVETIANLPDYQNDYGTGTNFTYAQANGSWGAPFVGSKDYASLTEIPHWFAGRPGMEAFDGTTVPYQAYPDNIKDFFNNGTLFENSLSISGGNEKSIYTATMSALNQDGFVPESKFLRHNVGVGGKTSLENGLVVGGNIAVTISKQDGVIEGVGSLGQNNPSLFARTMLLGRNWDLQGQPFQNPVDLGSEFMVGRSNANNPYWSVQNTGIRTDVNRYVANLNFAYDVFDWFNITYRVGINNYNQRTQEFQRPNGTGTTVGTLSEFNAANTEINSDLLFGFNGDINEDFSFRAIAGWNVNQRTRNVQQLNGTGYVIFDIDDLDNLGAVAPAGGDYQRKRIVGFFGDVNIGYRDWAFLGLTGRNDLSSTLPKGANSFFYPAVSASFVLTEALNLTSDQINFIKLRGSWSQVGNDTDPYLLSTPYLVNNSIADNITNTTAQKPFRGISGATLSNVGTNPNLLPERTTEYEVGLESRFINSRVGFDITYYKRNTSDQIAQITTPEETGFTSFLTNFGEVSNEGVEITLDVTPVSTNSGFVWNILGTFTHNKNKIESLAEGITEIQFGSGFAGGVRPVHRTGQEFGLLLGSVNVRDQEGNLLIDPGNGQMIPAPDLDIIGNPNADFTTGLVNNFNYKGFNLNILFDWRQGGDVYSSQISDMLGRGVLGFQADRERPRVIKGIYGNPNTLEPIIDEQGNKTPNQTAIQTNDLYFGETFASNGKDEWVVFDGTVYRLREASLTYTFPRSLIESTPFGNIVVGFSGRNLWYLAPNFPEGSNYDPETNQFGARNSQGIEFGTTPSARRYAFNIKLQF